jgi:hypothetical protein
MKAVSILLVSLVLLSMLETAITVGTAPPSQSAPAAQARSIPADEVPRRAIANTTLTLATCNATPLIGQMFTLSGRLSVSNGSSAGIEILRLYRSVNDGEYKLCWTLTTKVDGTFSQNFTYNTAAILKYYAVFDQTSLYYGSQSNKVTVIVMKAA